MTTQRTPGPWKAGQTSSGAFIEITYTTEQGIVEPIATCHEISLPRSSDQRTQAKANARLIAAAPDLLEALEVILNTPDLLDVIQDSLTGEIAGTSETQAITYMREIARLAIAKAKNDASA